MSSCKRFLNALLISSILTSPFSAYAAPKSVGDSSDSEKEEMKENKGNGGTNTNLPPQQADQPQNQLVQVNHPAIPTLEVLLRRLPMELYNTIFFLATGRKLPGRTLLLLNNLKRGDLSSSQELSAHMERLDAEQLLITLNTIKTENAAGWFLGSTTHLPP